MSMITRIEQTIMRAMAQGRTPKAIKMTEASLVRFVEAMRRHDPERAGINIVPINGAPYVWDTFKKCWAPIRPAFWYLNDYQIKIPFVVSDLMPDDQFIMEMEDKPAPLKVERTLEEKLAEEGPMDTGRVE